jgi:hypothetical protein
MCSYRTRLLDPTIVYRLFDELCSKVGVAEEVELERGSSAKHLKDSEKERVNFSLQLSPEQPLHLLYSIYTIRLEMQKLSCSLEKNERIGPFSKKATIGHQLSGLHHRLSLTSASVIA